MAPTMYLRSSMNVEGSRHGQITADDHGPIITIIALFLMVTMILAVIFRLMVRTVLTHSPGVEDGIICGSLVLGVGQVMALSLGVNNGLGRRMENLSKRGLVNVEKATYASDILYISTLCLAKISVLYLLKRLTSKAKHRYYISVVNGIIACWTGAAILSIAFQCGLRHPWSDGEKSCIAMIPFWNAIGCFDILSEILIMLQPIWLVWDLQMSRWNKTVIVGAFLFRIVVPVTIVLRLIYLRMALTASDTTFRSVASSIWTQSEVCSSIVTACIPVTKPFLDGFASGRLGNSLRQRIPRNARVGSYAMQTLGNGPRAHQKKFDTANDDIREPGPIMGTTAVATAQATRMARMDLAETPSISSARSDQMMIKRTEEWYVQYEDKSKFSNETLEGPSQAGHSPL